MMALDFPSIAYGSKGSPHDLRVLAYRDGPNFLRHIAYRKMQNDELGPLIEERVPFLTDIHAHLRGQLALGKSHTHLRNLLNTVRVWYKWCNEEGIEITHNSAEQAFYAWVERRIHCIRIEKSIKEESARSQTKALDIIISKILDIELGLIRNTRMAKSSQDRANPKKSDKTNLSEAYKFGHALLDIIRALHPDAIYGKLPVVINLHCGNTLTEYCQLAPPEKIKALTNPKAKPRAINAVLSARKKWEDEHTPRTRFSIINLRIEAELLVFISQTSINLAQAATMPGGDFRFQTDGDYINVFRAYKKRRAGEVEFKIYKEYGEIFKNYLSWLAKICDSEDTRLFPFIYPNTIPADSSRRSFNAITRRLQPLGYTILRPMALKRLRLNYMLRKSLDPTLVAEMGQHTKETLLKVYDRPHHQIASVEISRFLKFVDSKTIVAVVGACATNDRSASAIDDSAKSAPEPDCINPVGCLFCIHQRDIDSADYVWTLATLRHCKNIELERAILPVNNSGPHPAYEAITAINDKLHAFAKSSELRREWTNEANDRVKEGNYHPAFSALIQMMED